MTFTEYQAIDAVNFSSLKALKVSPLQYQHDQKNPRAETAFFRVGRAIHAYILEPETFAQRFARFTGKVRRGKEWEAFKEANASADILSDDEWESAIGSARAVLAHPVASKIVKGGFRESVLTWTDEETGLKCKARLDLVSSRIVDLKSAARIGRHQFAAAAARLLYHGQFAFYADGAAANGIELAGDPSMVVVQSEPPHDVIAYRLPPQVVEAGRAEYRALLEKLRDCREADSWPGVAPDTLEDFSLPAWATADEDEVELTMNGVAMGGI